MCLYLFLLCIVFACEVCTVMVNNNNNNNSTSGPMLSDIPPQAQSTPSLGNKDTGCSKVDHSVQTISPEKSWHSHRY